MDNRVVHIFNEMEEEYDEIIDLWYSWIFSRLHYLIARKIISNWTGPKNVLDIGCGTGFQSFLYAKAGAETIGIDISDRLIEVAKRKLRHFNPQKPITFFDGKYAFVDKYDRKINQILSARPALPYIEPVFYIGDAQDIKEADQSFDHVNCCGSTFSFVPDYEKAISEISRCLKPNGTFVLEVEGKNNLDLLWTLLDSTILFGKLEYETSFKEALSLTLGSIGQHVKVEYPFGDIKNPVYMNIRLFKKRKLIKELKKAGLIVDQCYSIHSITNFIPSTKLDSGTEGFLTKSIFRVLSKLEERFPFTLPGCSIVLIGHKV